MIGLATIPLTDAREGPVKLAVEAPGRALALRSECLSWLPASGRLLLPVMDATTRRWFGRSCSPYVGEIESLATALALPGVWFLNGTYQWGCTAAARDEEGAPWLARTLDWPFHGLGRHMEVARMQGPAGEFYNVTWPGYVGVLTASAPGRFAAAINQAPLWRRTSAPWLRLFDLALNALCTWHIRFCPPDHLLRQVFETCRNFGEAKERLESTPIARPAIFTLIGCTPGERCVIERTEQGFVSRGEETSAANDWLRGRKPWEARVAAKFLLTSSYEEAAANSRRRREALSAWQQPFARAQLAWVVPPVLNPFTRCAIEMCPARGILRVAGYELEAGSELPRQITGIRELAHDGEHDAEPASTFA
jgi:hypothetical protein